MKLAEFYCVEEEVDEMSRLRIGITLSLFAGALLMAPGAWAVQGACCFSDGMCHDKVRTDDCEDNGGYKPGDGTLSCKPNNPCPQPEGGTCAVAADCIDGSGLACVEGICRTKKMAPVASGTGLLFLIGALAIGGGFAAKQKFAQKSSLS